MLPMNVSLSDSSTIAPTATTNQSTGGNNVQSGTGNMLKPWDGVTGGGLSPTVIVLAVVAALALVILLRRK